MDKSRKVRNELVAFTNKCHLVLLFRPARREETFQKFLNDLSSAKILALGFLVLCLALALRIITLSLPVADGISASLRPDQPFFFVIGYAVFSQLTRGVVNRRTKRQK